MNFDMEMTSYEDVQKYIQMMKEQEQTEQIQNENQNEKKEEEIETKETQEEKEIDVKSLIQTLSSPQIKDIISSWKEESKELFEIFKEEYDLEFESFETKWKSMKDEEKQAILIISLQYLHENEQGEMDFVENVFPDLNYLLEHHELILNFIQHIKENQRYCIKEIFDVDQLREMFEKECDKQTALFCVTSLLYARMCIATKFCLNIMIVTNEIEVE